MTTKINQFNFQQITLDFRVLKRRYEAYNQELVTTKAEDQAILIDFRRQLGEEISIKALQIISLKPHAPNQPYHNWLKRDAEDLQADARRLKLRENSPELTPQERNTIKIAKITLALQLKNLPSILSISVQVRNYLLLEDQLKNMTKQFLGDERYHALTSHLEDVPSLDIEAILETTASQLTDKEITKLLDLFSENKPKPVILRKILYRTLNERIEELCNRLEEFNQHSLKVRAFTLAKLLPNPTRCDQLHRLSCVLRDNLQKVTNLQDPIHYDPKATDCFCEVLAAILLLTDRVDLPSHQERFEATFEIVYDSLPLFEACRLRKQITLRITNYLKTEYKKTRDIKLIERALDLKEVLIVSEIFSNLLKEANFNHLDAIKILEITFNSGQEFLGSKMLDKLLPFIPRKKPYPYEQELTLMIKNWISARPAREVYRYIPIDSKLHPILQNIFTKTKGDVNLAAKAEIVHLMLNHLFEAEDLIDFINLFSDPHIQLSALRQMLKKSPPNEIETLRLDWVGIFSKKSPPISVLFKFLFTLPLEEEKNLPQFIGVIKLLSTRQQAIAIREIEDVYIQEHPAVFETFFHAFTENMTLQEIQSILTVSFNEELRPILNDKEIYFLEEILLSEEEICPQRPSYPQPRFKRLDIPDRKNRCVLYDPPHGKPGPEGWNIPQLKQKGPTCWYYNAKRLRPNYKHTQDPTHAMDRMREKEVSTYRKECSKHRRGLKDPGYVSEDFRRAQNKLCHTVDIANRIPQSLRQHPLERTSKWNEVTSPLSRLSIVYDLLLRDVYNLQHATWNPSQPIEQLIEQLSINGPHTVVGYLGFPYYTVLPQAAEKQLYGKKIYLLPEEAFFKESRDLHVVTIVGAEIAETREELVYIIDPNDTSDPDDPEGQRIYSISYDKLRKETSSLYWPLLVSENPHLPACVHHAGTQTLQQKISHCCDRYLSSKDPKEIRQATALAETLPEPARQDKLEFIHTKYISHTDPHDLDSSILLRFLF